MLNLLEGSGRRHAALLAFALLTGCSKDLESQDAVPCAADGTCPSGFAPKGSGAACTCYKGGGSTGEGGSGGAGGTAPDSGGAAGNGGGKGEQTSPAPGNCPEGTVGIPGGKYEMGQKPSEVIVEAFCLDVGEVLVQDYAACSTCTPPATLQSQSCNAGPDKAAHPTNCVDWPQAKAYCEFKGKRLPTEQEWEWAARHGADGWTYPWGEESPLDRVCTGGYSLSTCPEGDYGAYGFGMTDMAGNVLEWTGSDFDATKKVVRGGGWNEPNKTQLTTFYRIGYPPDYRNDTIGFRCAMSAP